MGVWADNLCSRESYYDNSTSPPLNRAFNKIILSGD